MTKKFTVSGIVQGIGFRPNVKRLALKYGIRGYVKNLGGSVEIAAQGAELDAFKSEIMSLPQAMITSFDEEDAAGEYVSFEIYKSGSEVSALPLLTPDISVCADCMDEFYDPNNRRYLHPFISCTRCGARYSIQHALPYDRPSIVMADFEMCINCAREYNDIRDIRCHAQTIACKDCGPVLSYTVDGEPLEEAVKTIKNGGIIAVKNVGGYHFACAANSESAARTLREIKQRDKKPFAVMFNTVDEIRECATVNALEENALTSAAKPIVLVRKVRDFAPSVCADSMYIGAFLPSDPIQHYLTKMCGVLVMTSANISGEPIITDNEKMFILHENTGGFEVLSHNRRILTPLDDSVCRVVCGKLQLVRRARGFTPLPVAIDAPADKTVLALGGDLKASFCYASEGNAYMSQYFGDLENTAAFDLWRNNIDRLGSLLSLTADAVIKDMHPLYVSGSVFEGKMLQHHFAHMASVMAEHRIRKSALGFIFDGTGFGIDRCVWGGEVIRYDGEFSRVFSLEYTTFTGGNEAAQNGTLALDCFLTAAGLEPVSENGALIRTALKNNVNTVKSSSMGRLFDAVSALLGICAYNSYEGECASKLEKAADCAENAYPLTLKAGEKCWRTSELIRDISRAVSDGVDKKSLALGFHRAVAEAIITYAENQNEKTIILSGGVFMNKILTEHCYYSLTERGYDVYINERVPTNDGGIALGQAWFALNRGE